MAVTLAYGTPVGGMEGLARFVQSFSARRDELEKQKLERERFNEAKAQFDEQMLERRRENAQAAAEAETERRFKAEMAETEHQRSLERIEATGESYGRNQDAQAQAILDRDLFRRFGLDEAGLRSYASERGISVGAAMQEMERRQSAVERRDALVAQQEAQIAGELDTLLRSSVSEGVDERRVIEFGNRYNAIATDESLESEERVAAYRQLAGEAQQLITIRRKEKPPIMNYQQMTGSPAGLMGMTDEQIAQQYGDTPLGNIMRIENNPLFIQDPKTGKYTQMDTDGIRRAWEAQNQNDKNEKDRAQKTLSDLREHRSKAMETLMIDAKYWLTEPGEDGKDKVVGTNYDLMRKDLDNLMAMAEGQELPHAPQPPATQPPPQQPAPQEAPPNPIAEVSRATMADPQRTRLRAAAGTRQMDSSITQQYMQLARTLAPTQPIEVHRAMASQMARDDGWTFGE